MTIIIPTWLIITFIVLFVFRIIVRLTQFHRGLKVINKFVKSLSGDGIIDYIKLFMKK